MRLPMRSGMLPSHQTCDKRGKVKRRRERLREGSPWTQLVAGIVDVSPDVLTERIARAERRRLQGIFGGLVALLVVVSTLAVFAWIQRNNAVEQSLIATTRQLAATAKTTAETDLQSALLLADTAYRTRAEPQTIEALHAVLTTTPQLDGVLRFRSSSRTGRRHTGREDPRRRHRVRHRVSVGPRDRDHDRSDGSRRPDRVLVRQRRRSDHRRDRRPVRRELHARGIAICDVARRRADSAARQANRRDVAVGPHDRGVA